MGCFLAASKEEAPIADIVGVGATGAVYILRLGLLDDTRYEKDTTFIVYTK